MAGNELYTGFFQQCTFKCEKNKKNKKNRLAVTQQASMRGHYDLGLFHLVVYLLLTRDLKHGSFLKYKGLPLRLRNIDLHPINNRVEGI